MKRNSGGKKKKLSSPCDNEVHKNSVKTHLSLYNFELLRSIQLNKQLQVKINVLSMSSAFVKISVIPLFHFRSSSCLPSYNTKYSVPLKIIFHLFVVSTSKIERPSKYCDPRTV